MVGHDDVVLVSDEHAHVIFNGDIVSKDVAVPDVPVILFVVDVKLLQGLVYRHVQGERVFLGFIGSICPLVVLRADDCGQSGTRYIQIKQTDLRPTAFCSVLLAVESRLAHTDDLLRRAIHPPIDQVEVVAGFVNHKTTRVVLRSMPSLVRAICLDQIVLCKIGEQALTLKSALSCPHNVPSSISQEFPVFQSVKDRLTLSDKKIASARARWRGA